MGGGRKNKGPNQTGSDDYFIFFGFRRGEQHKQFQQGLATPLTVELSALVPIRLTVPISRDGGWASCRMRIMEMGNSWSTAQTRTELILVREGSTVQQISNKRIQSS